jgi:hypothetical protein
MTLRLGELFLELALALAALATTAAAPDDPSTSPAVLADESLRAVKGSLVDADGQEVRLTGVNWFGLETGTFAPYGLWSRNWQDMLDQMVAVEVLSYYQWPLLRDRDGADESFVTLTNGRRTL